MTNSPLHRFVANSQINCHPFVTVNFTRRGSIRELQACSARTIVFEYTRGNNRGQHFPHGKRKIARTREISRKNTNSSRFVHSLITFHDGVPRDKVKRIKRTEFHSKYLDTDSRPDKLSK